jgi:hypothetical protein
VRIVSQANPHICLLGGHNRTGAEGALGSGNATQEVEKPPDQVLGRSPGGASLEVHDRTISISLLKESDPFSNGIKGFIPANAFPVAIKSSQWKQYPV